MRLLRWLGLALLLAAAPARGADLMLRSTHTTSGGPAPATHEETEWMTASTIVTDAPDERSIVDLHAKRVTVVDKTERTWFTLDAEALRAQAKAAQERMRALPPDARRTMEQVLGMPGEAALAPTGRSERIAGYEAKEYAVTAGMTRGTVWVTDALHPPFDVAAWREYASTAMVPSGPGRAIAEAFAKIDGIPLRRTMHLAAIGGAELTSTMEVVEVREASPPPEMLHAPAGFTEAPAPTGREAAGP